MTADRLATRSAAWDVWIDTGGTFTDCMARDPGGRLHRAKVLSSGMLRGVALGETSPGRIDVAQNWDLPDDFITGWRLRRVGGLVAEASAAWWTIAGFDATRGEITLSGEGESCWRGPFPAVIEIGNGTEAPILAARLVTRTPRLEPLPPLRMRLATTLCTNALLERRGAPAALFITQGFADLLLIGTQQRPDIFALHIERPPPLHDRVIEVPERLSADGSTLRPLDIAAVMAEARAALDAGIRSAAVALVHSYANPAHERRLGAALRDAGFEHVCCSSDAAPMIRLLPRAQTCVAESYLSPVLGGYLERISAACGEARLHVLTSAGGLVRGCTARATECLLSGPAGGVAGAAAAGRASGFERIIGFDMGGTSTDVARVDAGFEYAFEHEVGGVSIVAPALAIHTVAAGGGSICAFSEGRLRVGPRSAGASPGPACYGAGGPLTLTDVNLLLGRLEEDRFEIPIDRAASERRLDGIWMALAPGERPASCELLLQGFLDLADEHMADAIAEVSLRQGFDPAGHALVSFGGAGGQHACAVADRLGIRTIVMPVDASLLSACGLAHAAIERFAQRQVLRTLDEVEGHLETILSDLATEAGARVEAEAVPRESIEVSRRILHMRLAGQEHSLAVETGAGETWRAAFGRRYQAIYGHVPGSQKPIEIDAIRVAARSRSEAGVFAAAPAAAVPAPVKAARFRRAWIDGRWIHLPAHDRADLAPGAVVSGPALVMARRSTCLIGAGWRAMVDGAGALIARRVELPERSASRAAATDRTSSAGELVEMELSAGRFAAIARQMGRMLERTAVSTNVKERLDFSCALLDSAGRLLVNAPHIPVHLGSLGVCVRAVREAIELGRGDVAATNHPALGGSHLPDITVVTPIHDDAGRVLGYAASRAHHAEIGGRRPGSMPPDARTLIEEGVVIHPRYLVRGGRDEMKEMAAVLRSARYPSRAVEDNLADLLAAVAANEHGRREVAALAKAQGTLTVIAQMDALMARADLLSMRAIRSLRDPSFEAEEFLDDGSPIRVRIRVEGDRTVIDFAGSAPQHRGNLNCTPAIVQSAVMYVLRLLIGERLPLNEGIMTSVDLRIPRGMLNPEFVADPSRCPAVAGGNVETSQRLVDTLLKAFGLCACSQGTMNNVLFGTDRFSYYETVCGGTGADAMHNGADAVHSHMTNTRITDVEVIEHRYPVRVERFGVRRGSGGRGRRRGGDGAVRELTFLAPMSLSILAQHRREGPYGREGGETGLPGRQSITAADGTVRALGGIDGCEVSAGDRLTLLTPGGGGWGAPERGPRLAGPRRPDSDPP